MRDYVKGKPPAADAGPRQSDTCKNCYKPIWFDSIPGRGWRHEDHRYECFSPTKAEPLAPPVPQEAAPARHKHTWMPYIRSCSVCGQLERLENDYEK